MLLQTIAPFEGIMLYPETDNAVSAPTDEGQGVPEEAPVEAGQADTTPEHFYSYKYDDGEERVFSRKEELDEFMRDAGLRHSDYTRKTQKHAETVKEFENRMKQFEDEKRRVLEMAEKHKKFDEVLKRLPPQEFARLKQQLQGQPQQANDLNQEKIEKLLEERMKPYNEFMQEQERQKTLSRAYETLSKKYPDFDQKAVQGMTQWLQEAGPGDEATRITELIHLASIGRKKLSELQSKGQSNYRPPAPAASTGGASPKPKAKGKVSWDDLAQQAKNALFKE